MAVHVPAASLLARLQPEAKPSDPGRTFLGTRASLAAYRAPDWFPMPNSASGLIGGRSRPPNTAIGRAHMYIEGHKRYTDITWKLAANPSKFRLRRTSFPPGRPMKFDPDQLMQLYKRPGPGTSSAWACNHDNFDLWNSASTSGMP